MVSEYNPDGWLGFIIGTQLFYDFSGKYPFEQKFSELFKAIQLERNVDHMDSEMPTTGKGESKVQPVSLYLNKLNMEVSYTDRIVHLFKYMDLLF